MSLADISRAQGHFYVPTFAVKVAGKDLLRKHLIAVAQADVDLSLGGAGKFSFTIHDAFDPIDREFRDRKTGLDLFKLLTFGAPIEVQMGYGDVADLPVLISGQVTNISTGFSEGGSPELTVSGYDHAYPLTVGKNTRTWDGKRDSEAVETIAGENNLRLDSLRTPDVRDHIEQKQESDFEFINRLAKQNRYEAYVTERTLRFGPPQYKSSSVVTLEWGRGLLSFKPEANLAGQVSAVEVVAWDVKNSREIKGRAERGEETGRDPRSSSAADLLSEVLRRQPVLRVREPVVDQAEAKNRARALLQEQAEDFLTGEGETIGLPGIRPDCNITLSGLGRFSRDYYVEQATHKFDSGGYRTRFKVKEPSAWQR